MVLGGGYIAGGSEVTAQLDSETRFLSTIALGAGALSIWLINNFEQYPKPAIALGLCALVGGVMRIVSIGLYGVPGTTALIATALELIIPTAMIALISQRDQSAA